MAGRRAVNLDLVVTIVAVNGALIVAVQYIIARAAECFGLVLGVQHIITRSAIAGRRAVKQDPVVTIVTVNGAFVVAVERIIARAAKGLGLILGRQPVVALAALADMIAVKEQNVRPIGPFDHFAIVGFFLGRLIGIAAEHLHQRQTSACRQKPEHQKFHSTPRKAQFRIGILPREKRGAADLATKGPIATATAGNTWPHGHE
ncbi:MAG: hypothetical protein WBP18_19365, partial [Paracoccaceae bacterium]